MADSPKTDASELDVYLEAGWQLIPLHPWDRFDRHKGKKRARGKSPLHSNWTRRPYGSEDQVGHMKDGNNVGVRLTARQMVIDVDPRNGGDEGFRRLCDDLGLDPAPWPHVETGGGGSHYYLVKPGNISIVDSLPVYAGVEFKTLGRQVVAAGSVHPTTKRTYVWTANAEDLWCAPDVPEALLKAMQRPPGTAPTGGGEYAQEELAQMLDALNPEDFRDHDRWLKLMLACHHATAGDGRQEFIEWSTLDPEYADHGGLIGRRWDSLHADNGRTDGSARVTYRTLQKILIDAGEEAGPAP